MHLSFKLVLLHQDYRNNVDGYVQYFELPMDKMIMLVYDHATNERETKAVEKLKGLFSAKNESK